MHRTFGEARTGQTEPKHTLTHTHSLASVNSLQKVQSDFFFQFQFFFFWFFIVSLGCTFALLCLFSICKWCIESFFQNIYSYNMYICMCLYVNFQRNALAFALLHSHLPLSRLCHFYVDFRKSLFCFLRLLFPSFLFGHFSFVYLCFLILLWGLNLHTYLLNARVYWSTAISGLHTIEVLKIFGLFIFSQN